MKTTKAKPITPEAIAAQAAFIKSAYQVEDSREDDQAKPVEQDQEESEDDIA